MKTLDHAFNVDGLRKSGPKLKKGVEIRANLRTNGCVPTPNGHEQKQYGRCRACPKSGVRACKGHGTHSPIRSGDTKGDTKNML
jgi:hypothetical protein